MTLVTQHHLQSVRAWCQSQLSLCLTATKVDVVVVSWHAVNQLIRTVLTFSKIWPVDKQVVVTRVFFFSASRGNTHPGQAKDHFER